MIRNILRPLCFADHSPPQTPPQIPSSSFIQIYSSQFRYINWLILLIFSFSLTFMLFLSLQFLSYFWVRIQCAIPVGRCRNCVPLRLIIAYDTTVSSSIPGYRMPFPCTIWWWSLWFLHFWPIKFLMPIFGIFAVKMDLRIINYLAFCPIRSIQLEVKGKCSQIYGRPPNITLSPLPYQWLGMIMIIIFRGNIPFVPFTCWWSN